MIKLMYHSADRKHAILLDKGVKIKKIRRVVLTLCVNCGEMVLLKMKVPSFDTSWWSGHGIIENQLNWLTISIEDEVSTKQVSV